MSNMMSAKEVLEVLIDDLKDTIDDYRDSELHSRSKLDRYDYKIKKNELIRWKRALEEQLKELED